MCFGSPNLLVLQSAPHKRESRTERQRANRPVRMTKVGTIHRQRNMSSTKKVMMLGANKLGLCMSGLLSIRKIRMVCLIGLNRNQSHTLIFRSTFALLNCLIISSSLLPESMQVESSCTNSTFVSKARQDQHICTCSCGKCSLRLLYCAMFILFPA
jgi:hypothetical protein